MRVFSMQHTAFLSLSLSLSLIYSSWSNLEDLHKWLTVRDVHYTYSPQGQYKGATYTGKWNNGIPHIW